MRGDRLQIIGEQDYITGEVLEARIRIWDGRDSIDFDPEMLPDVEAAADEVRRLTAGVAMSDPGAILQLSRQGVIR